MTLEEAKQFIDEKKAEGMEEEDILTVFCEMFVDGKLELESLKHFLDLLGYELSEEFLALDPEKQKQELLEDVEDEVEEKEPEEKTEEEDLEDEDAKARKLFGLDEK